MKVLQNLLRDEFGSILSAELVLVGTIGLIAVTAGWRSLSRSIDAELFEMASAIRHLDQSFSVSEVQIGGDWSAGSEYIQPDLDQSVAELEESYHRDRQRVEERIDCLERRFEEASEKEIRESNQDAPLRRPRNFGNRDNQ